MRVQRASIDRSAAFYPRATNVRVPCYSQSRAVARTLSMTRFMTSLAVEGEGCNGCD